MTKQSNQNQKRICGRYISRNQLLRELGYRSYSEYLKSDDWKAIRAGVMASDPLCVMCDCRAQVLHHVKYTADVLLGLAASRLAPLCHRCHEHIEIDEAGEKRSMMVANTMLFEAIRKTPHGLGWERAYREDGIRLRCYQAAEQANRGFPNWLKDKHAKRNRRAKAKQKRNGKGFRPAGSLSAPKCLDNFEELWNRGVGSGAGAA